MGSDEGENTSFPCLATVRSLLAAVVTVLAVAVVVMVIVVVHRPEDISLSIGGGYVQTGQVWWKELVRETKEGQIDGPVNVNAGGLPSNVGQKALLPRPVPSTATGIIGVDYDPRPGRGGDADEPVGDIQTEIVSVRSYARATDPVRLEVSLSAHNPSGRGPVTCNVTDIRVLDMPDGASSTGRELLRAYSAKDPLRFIVPPQTTHTEKQMVTINDTDTLQYLFDNYKGKNSFRAMVRVSTTITSRAQLSWATGKNVDHCCGPVDVVYGTPDDRAYGAGTCSMQSSATPFSCDSSSATTPYSQPPAPAPTG